MARFFLFCLFLTYGELSAKVLIMTHCYNRPEFIYWQVETFKKFLVDDYEFVVFNDAPNQELFELTEKTCRDLSILSLPVPQTIHTGREGPSVECGDTIQYMMKMLGFSYEGPLVLIDSDMFLIKELSIEKYLETYEIVANPQTRMGQHGVVTYLLPNLIFFNMQTLPDKYSLNFDLGLIDGVRTDTAGYTFFYLASHPHVKWLKTDVFNSEGEASRLEKEAASHLSCQSKLWNLNKIRKYEYEFYMGFAFVHFRAGSNWNGVDENTFNEKKRHLLFALEELLRLSDVSDRRLAF